MRLEAWLILALIVTFVGSSCGALSDYDRIDSSAGYTKVKIVSGDIENEVRSGALTASQLNGIQIYFRSLSSPLFQYSYYVGNENTLTTFNIPNGTYQVFSFGYGSTGLSAGATIKCGFANNGNAISLMGVDQTIEISLNSQDCAPSSSFAQTVIHSSFAESTYTFRPIRIMNCSSTEFTLVSQYSSTCPSTLLKQAKSVGARISPYQVKEGTLTITPVSSETGVTTCVNLSSAVASTALPLPVGNGSSVERAPRIVAQIFLYSQLDCETSSLSKTYEFDPYQMSSTSSALGLLTSLLSPNRDLILFPPTALTSSSEGRLFLKGL